MEYILGVGILVLLSSKFIKNIIYNTVFVRTIIFSVTITLIYKLPCIVSFSIIILIQYCLKDFIINIKILIKSLIKSKKRYNNGFLGKLVNILINCNYLVLSIFTYLFLSKELLNSAMTDSSILIIAVSVIAIISIKMLRQILNSIITF